MRTSVFSRFLVHYKTAVTSGMRDVDSFERVVWSRVFIWSFVGALLGLLLGFFAMASGRGPWVLPVCVLAGWGSSYLGPLFIAHMAGRAGGSLYAPSVKSTPRKATPLLARTAGVESDTLEGAWAAKALAELKRAMSPSDTPE